MKRIRNLLPVIFFIYTTALFAETPQIKTYYYYANGGESLRELLENQAMLDSYVLDDLGFYKNISRWNRSIKNQNSLKKGQQVYVEIPYDFVGFAAKRKPKKVAPIKLKKTSLEACRMPASLEGLNDQEVSFLKKINDKAKNIKGKISGKLETFADFLRIFKVSSYYSLSRNIFEESVIDTTTRTQTSQDSPLTLGTSFDWQWDPNISFAGDFYLSKMDDAITSDNKPFTLPIYFGGTVKMGFKRTFWPFTMYGGMEHDRFASFNSEEAVTTSDIRLRTHDLFNVGIGAKKDLVLFDQTFILNGFYSQTFFSKTSKASSVRPRDLKGSKFSIEGRWMYSKDWFYQAYYKQMDLEGPTVLHIARFGLGFGVYF